MKRTTISMLSFSALIIASVAFSSCESCVRKASKKATTLAISAAEGVSEAITEHGEEAGEKLTDALGTVAKGAGKSVERQLNEHAEHVASVVGRTFVQSIDGLTKGLSTELYDEVQFTTNLPSGVSLNSFGKIKNKDVVDAYFVVTENGSYETVFEFLDKNGNALMTRKAEIYRTNTSKTYTVVSFAFNESEKQLFEQSNKVRITASRKS